MLHCKRETFQRSKYQYSRGTRYTCQLLSRGRSQRRMSTWHLSSKQAKTYETFTKTSRPPQILINSGSLTTNNSWCYRRVIGRWISFCDLLWSRARLTIDTSQLSLSKYSPRLQLVSCCKQSIYNRTKLCSSGRGSTGTRGTGWFCRD